MLPHIDASAFGSMREFLRAFGALTLQATQTRHCFARVHFFAELAMTNPVFQKAQRELAGPEAHEELPCGLEARMSIVLNGVSGARRAPPGRARRSERSAAALPDQAGIASSAGRRAAASPALAPV